jgi:hypothetical protein
MNKTDIAGIRLLNQQIAASKFTKPEEIVSWFGAMQAQDYPMAKWAIGLRLPGSTAETIEAAVASGKILRTHILRPTWHFVVAEDLRWMLALTASRIRSASAGMFRELGLDQKVFQKSNRVIAKALRNGNHLTRAELRLELEKVGLITNEMRMTCFVFNAELDSLICSGARRGKHQTYALLDERAPKTADLSREESIAELARRYFKSHAPATLKDFVWWSGLSVTDAKKGLEMNKSILISEEIEEQTYWMPASVSVSVDAPDSFYLLPAFDEFMVAYKDRSASLEPHRAKEMIVGHGIFKPIIVAGGKIAGVWKRSFKKDSVIVEKIAFKKLTRAENKAFAEKAKEFAAFEGKEAGILSQLSAQI